MSVLPGVYNIDVYRGDSYSAVLTYKENSVGVDLTGCTIVGSIKMTAVSPVVASFTVAIDADQVTNPGQFVISLTAAQTAAFEIESGVYDIQCTYTTGVVQTFLKGSFTVTKDVS